MSTPHLESVSNAATDKERGAVLAVSRRYGNTLVALMFLHLWLANSTFKAPQIACELLIAALLAFPLLRATFGAAEVGLALVYLASMAAAVVKNDLATSLLDAKIMGLSILALLFFSRVRFEDRISNAVIVFNIAFSVYLRVAGAPGWFVSLVDSYARSWAGLANSRPLGLFLSTHFSAAVSATYLLYLVYRSTRWTVPSTILLYLCSSYFNLVSFVGQLAGNVLAKLRLQRPLYLLVLIAIPIAFVNASAIITFDIQKLASVFSSREQVSYTVITGQLLNVQAYARALVLVPANSTDLAINFLTEGNEIGLFTLVQQAGLVLAIWFYWMLLTRVRGFRTMLTLSMLHYGIATVPIGIYLMMHYSSLSVPFIDARARRSIRSRVPASHRPPVLTLEA